MPYFDGAKGRIFHQAWLPAGSVRGVVVLAHGYGEHIGLYDALAQRLTADGFAVHGADGTGHGRSDGRRAVIESWDDNVADLLRLCEVARAAHPGAPIALAGHSGGAVTAALLAMRSPGLARAVVLSGSPLLPLGWVDDELATDWMETEGGDPTEALSTHPDYVDALVNDPLTWKGGFRRETLLALRATWQELGVGLAAGRPAVPTLLVHGAADPVVPVADARQVASGLPDARLVEFAGDLHDVLNEHDRDAVHDVVAEFLRTVLVGQPEPPVVALS